MAFFFKMKRCTVRNNYFFWNTKLPPSPLQTKKHMKPVLFFIKNYFMPCLLIFGKKARLFCPKCRINFPLSWTGIFYFAKKCASIRFSNLSPKSFFQVAHTLFFFFALSLTKKKKKKYIFCFVLTKEHAISRK